MKKEKKEKITIKDGWYHTKTLEKIRLEELEETLSGPGPYEHDSYPNAEVFCDEAPPHRCVYIHNRGICTIINGIDVLVNPDWLLGECVQIGTKVLFKEDSLRDDSNWVNGTYQGFYYQDGDIIHLDEDGDHYEVCKPWEGALEIEICIDDEDYALSPEALTKVLKIIREDHNQSLLASGEE